MNTKQQLILFRKKFLIAIANLSMLQLASCSLAFYSPARLGSDMTYQPKPMISDSLKVNTYLSAVYHARGADNVDDQKFYAELNVNRAHAFNNWNLSYGANSYVGNYTNGLLTPNDTYYFEQKSFWGYGFRSALNYVMSTGRTDFRFPGFEFSYSKELGAYADFRQVLTQQSEFFYAEPKSDLCTLGGSVELIWHQKKYTYNRFSFRLFLGRTLGKITYRNQFEYYADNNQENVYNWSFMFQHKQLSFLFESSRMLKIGLIYGINKY